MVSVAEMAGRGQNSMSDVHTRKKSKKRKRNIPNWMIISRRLYITAEKSVCQKWKGN
jgi:hypothetical protein